MLPMEDFRFIKSQNAACCQPCVLQYYIMMLLPAHFRALYADIMAYDYYHSTIDH